MVRELVHKRSWCPEIVQAADVHNWDGRVNSWLDVGGVKRSRFGGVLIYAQRNVERALNVPGSSIDVEQHTIAVGASHRKSVRLGEVDNRLVVLRGGAEQLHKLFGCQILAILRAAWVVKLAEEIR